MGQGRNMTEVKGMRKGITLVEILIAIVLMGVLATVSYKYYKTYYDTTFAAKQARVAIIVEQALQLSNAHDLYEVKNGIEPLTVAAMVTDRQLLSVPVVPNVVSNPAVGWDLYNPQVGATAPIALNDATANDVAFVLTIDGLTDAGAAVADKDRLDYCNIASNMANTALSLARLDAAVQLDTLTGYAEEPSFFCYNTQAAGTSPAVYRLAFVKRIDLN